QQALTLLFNAVRKDATDFLSENLAENRLVIVNSMASLYDVSEKVREMQGLKDVTILWVDKTDRPYFDERSGFFRANLIDTVNYLKRRDSRNNVVFFSVHAVWK